MDHKYSHFKNEVKKNKKITHKNRFYKTFYGLNHIMSFIVNLIEKKDLFKVMIKILIGNSQLLFQKVFEDYKK